MICKAMALRGCMACPCAGPMHGDAFPLRERLCQAVCGPIHISRTVSSKLSMAFQQQLGQREELDPVEKNGNPCSSELVETHLTFVTEEQNRLGVLQ